MQNIKKYFMTLALLLTAVTGAWAGEEPQLLTTIYASSSFLTGSQTFDDIATVTLGGAGTIAFNNNKGWIQDEYNEEATVTVTAVDGYTITSIKIYSADNNATISTSPFTAYLNKWGATYVTTGSGGAGDYVGDELVMIEVYGYKSEPAEPALTVEWDPATKTGNFVMPAYDVELTPIYAPVAQWAKVENVDQLPTAIEGIYAESTDAIVNAGTVAKIGETENPQGTVMYAVTSTNQATAPALDAFSADVPTAENITIGSEVLVWYYIKGADTPEGEDATAENTFNDSEICTEPITVTLLSNKFDIQFKAANDNTIEAGKATVKVGDEAAEVDAKGNLTGVKMNSKVTVTAKEGYKFRKVEVKKGIAPPAPTTITVTWNGADITGSGNSFTKDGVTITADDIEFMDKNFLTGGTFTTTLGNFTKIEVTTEGWYASGTGWSGSTWTGNASSVSFSGDIMGYGGDNLKFVFTIEPMN